MDGVKVEFIAGLHDGRFHRHTAEWVGEKIAKTLDALNLKLSDVESVTSDAASNLTKSYTSLGLSCYLNCGCHLIHRSFSFI